MNPRCSKYRYSSGFSLVEMMLAMLIGLIIMAGVMQIFVSSSDTQRSSEDQLNLLADARFAMETIAYDLRHTGLWGRQNNPTTVTCRISTIDTICPSAMPLAASDCAVSEYINLDRPLFAEDNANPYSTTCANQSYKAGTDVLTVRYADTNRLATSVLGTNVAYIRSSMSTAMIFTGPTYPAKAMFLDWNDDDVNSNHLLVSRTYYVSDYTDSPGDGLPSLRRADLVAGPAMKSDVLLPGVEDLQLEFGVDIGVNGVLGGKDDQVDSYVDADKINSGVFGLAWNNGSVVAVRIWILMRSQREDRDDVGGEQTFTIAGGTPVTFNDGYRRHLITSVVKLRNTYQRDLMKVGG